MDVCFADSGFIQCLSAWVYNDQVILLRSGPELEIALA